MKRNPRNRHVQVKPLKITVSEAEILADLQYGVDGRSRPGRARRREHTAR